MAAQINPSILSADFARLADEAKAVEEPTGSTSTSWTTISSRTSRSVCRS